MQNRHEGANKEQSHLFVQVPELSCDILRVMKFASSVTLVALLSALLPTCTTTDPLPRHVQECISKLLKQFIGKSTVKSWQT